MLTSAYFTRAQATGTTLKVQVLQEVRSQRLHKLR